MLELELIMWPVIINGFDICHMLNVCVCCPVISAQSQRFRLSSLRCSVPETKKCINLLDLVVHE